MAVRICVPLVVVKIFSEQSELPELIGDVLADIGDSSVRPDNDLAVVLASRLVSKRRAGHHPAAFVLAFGFEIDSLALFQLLERRSPELQMQDFAFAGQN